MEKLISDLKELGQEHIIEMFPNITEDHPIFKQLIKFDLHKSINRFNSAKKTVEYDADHIKPVSPVDYCSLSQNEKDKLISRGIEVIQKGTVGAVILSGGQGTRLGFHGPKGMYSIGLPSAKCIFQIHIEKIMRMRILCENDGKLPSIPIYVMTSHLNDQIIRDYFCEKKYFGYPSEDIFFFEQGLELCLSMDGKIIVESDSSLALAPDGNGGIYSALQTTKAIDDMIQRNIEHLHIFGIDNILTNSLDPSFLGLCVSNGIECGNKVVWRASASEKVGVTVNYNERMSILEYSEIPTAFADAVDSSGKLIYGAANLCNHYLSVAFLRNVVLPQLSDSYHIAKKKITYWDPTLRQSIAPSSNNGIKLEMFIFDVFPLAQHWIVMNVDRRDEFAPVKNEPGSCQDSPDTARTLWSQQGLRWLQQVGAHVVTGDGNDVNWESILSQNILENDLLCEISPLMSIGGENLESYRGKTVTLPIYISSPL